MNPTIAEARKRRKLRETIGRSAMLISLVGIVLLVSWFEYDLFRQFYEPLVSIVLVVVAWICTGAMFFFVLAGRINGTGK